MDCPCIQSFENGTRSGPVAELPGISAKHILETPDEANGIRELHKEGAPQVATDEVLMAET